ncbi:MAG: hypothetical protein J6X80_03160 [Lachnospiraceae bacterium]|nr:hypothetical protein [Lachnospiraceae bacterium]
MSIKKVFSKLHLKRLLAGLLAAGAAVFFCACELPGTEISYDGKENGVYHAHIQTPEEITPEPPEPEDPGYTESSESYMMSFVVPNDFEKMEYFSREDFKAKNPEVTYSDEELITVTEAYFSYLEKFAETGWQIKFDYAYINNDNLPELVYTSYSGDTQLVSAEFHFCTYDFDANEVIEIGSYYSQYGMGFYYVEKENLLYYFEWGPNDWVRYDYYLTINKDNKFELVASFDADLSFDKADSTAHVNHVETDYDTAMEYKEIFDKIIFSDAKELNSYSLNVMIPLEGGFVFINDEYEYEDFYGEYETKYLDAISDQYAETLKRKGDDCGYTFVYLNGDNMPDIFIKEKGKLCVYHNSVYNDEYNRTVNAYVYQIYEAEFEGNVSYSEYCRVIHVKTDENGIKTDKYYLIDQYDCLPVIELVSENENKFYINGGPVTKERFDKYSGAMSNYTFIDITDDDLYSDKDAKSVKKHFNEVLGNYNPYIF